MNFAEIKVDNQLRLIQLVPEQADLLFKLTDDNRDHLSEFLDWPPYVKTIDDSRQHIEQTIAKRKEGTAYSYGIELGGTIVGMMSLMDLDDSQKMPQIGYWVSAEYAGKGLATQSARAITEFGLEVIGLDKIKIRASPQNRASNRVAEKLGFVQSGDELHNGELLNVWIISN